MFLVYIVACGTFLESLVDLERGKTVADHRYFIISKKQNIEKSRVLIQRYPS